MKRDPLVRANANYMLGKMCETGSGTEKDWEKAHFYYTRAAGEGHIKAKACLDALSEKAHPETIHSKSVHIKRRGSEKSVTSTEQGKALQ